MKIGYHRVDGLETVAGGDENRRILRKRMDNAVGIASLIDEATGYQYVREPDALQRIFDRFLRDEASDWSEKFGKEFYATISKALGLPYDGKRPPGGRAGQITLRFVSQLVSVTRNAAGEVTEGDPETVADVTDVWTFARDLGARDPNWKLVATEAAS